MNNIFYLTISFLVCQNIFGQLPYPKCESRDPYKQPFASTSIWNMPIGNKAKYVHARLEPALLHSLTVDEDYIVLTPDSPMIDVYVNHAGWGRRDRCLVEGEKMYSVPFSKNFMHYTYYSDKKYTPNAGLAVLMPDKRSIRQTQPFSYCSGGYATSKYNFEEQDIYGDGYYGAHGGSGLSAIGGALRMGELKPGSGPIRHALKINVYAEKNVYYDEETKGFCWPATAADGYAHERYGKKRTTAVVKECLMGSLLALPPKIKIASLKLETEPAKIMAQAFQDYGAYIVDNTAWDVNAIITENSPNGRFSDQFMQDWGFSISTKPDTPWGRDIAKIFANLHVVINNSPARIGGGGKPRAPIAPPLKTPDSEWIKGSFAADFMHLTDEKLKPALDINIQGINKAYNEIIGANGLKAETKTSSPKLYTVAVIKDGTAYVLLSNYGCESGVYELNTKWVAGKGTAEFYVVDNNNNLKQSFFVGWHDIMHFQLEANSFYLVKIFQKKL